MMTLTADESAAIRDLHESIDRRGGGTVALNGSAKVPEIGYLVGGFADEWVMLTPTYQTLEAFVAENHPLLSRGNPCFLGGWRDPETQRVHIDVVCWFPPNAKEHALRVAALLNQKAVWNISENKSIQVVQ